MLNASLLGVLLLFSILFYASLAFLRLTMHRTSKRKLSWKNQNSCVVTTNSSWLPFLLTLQHSARDEGMIWQRFFVRFIVSEMSSRRESSMLWCMESHVRKMRYTSGDEAILTIRKWRISL